MTKFTEWGPLSIGKVIVSHTPKSACFCLSSFSAVYKNMALPPANVHGILGTLTFCVVPAKNSFRIWLPFILCMPSKESRVSPVKVLIPIIPGFSASLCDGLTYRALPSHPETEYGTTATSSWNISHQYFHGSYSQWMMSTSPSFLKHL